MLSIKNPNPSTGLEPLKRFHRASSSSSSSPMALCSSPSLRLRPPAYRVSLAAPKGFAVGFRSLHSRLPFHHSVVAFAASHEESHSEMEVEGEKDELEMGSEEESNEAWKQALASFKEQALKLQSVSLEAYEVHSKKALITLKETSEVLKVQAEKARNDLTEVVKEMSEEGKEYLSTAAENSPPEVKEIVETFSSSAEDFNDVSKVHDFHVGIPYGFILSVGGFLSFMVTGSISAIRFGIILGGALLALSVSSLKSHKRGESSPLAIKGQAVISSVLFLRELSLLILRSTLCSFLTTVISGAVVAFYMYKLLSKDKPRLEPGTGN
ncbi:hypothetical protein ERO13_A02G003100v2 [Gossypium hirsutum]|uniref:Protein FATTY ACID EXPORT 3, chloroplastic isoform X2 n=2 Tax=Gossypium TaxID=3633 RepID=A0A1U8MB99_GOSHI|nr:protein FATTY ACID EXPORT 3, chloroplastic isoform X2 [Gossypium hirsutum]XP_040943414.1 protein FATTY ACID EXPORT 3, chloroplastic isoform X2 [Gossypium hirsutum]XP_040943418.1 protein FATTY ACID EXPORT 3, chloroplastic isoform X2 [Gossypium hirsutum]TYJ44714.1 hypothetical protein E1A91_A02G003300v1 [Gossypium mustelinum]KAG4209780.1 hypothetical protein ERO13_A02G003100v2 [Gossypium hirsutum]KAG4209781.1 hypothetical protein ERO13_A02G003100v2 [Gossypium hirsutum]KAG4209782.1 hypothetic